MKTIRATFMRERALFKSVLLVKRLSQRCTPRVLAQDQSKLESPTPSKYLPEFPTKSRFGRGRALDPVAPGRSICSAQKQMNLIWLSKRKMLKFSIKKGGGKRSAGNEVELSSELSFTSVAFTTAWFKLKLFSEYTPI